MCVGVVSMLQASACNMDTTPTQPHRNSNTHRTKNNTTTNVVIQQNSRKLLMMDILMSKTCWAHKKWNKMASDIKLVFYSSIIFVHSTYREWNTVELGYNVSKGLINCVVTKECHTTRSVWYKWRIIISTQSTSLQTHYLMLTLWYISNSQSNENLEIKTTLV